MKCAKCLKMHGKKELVERMGKSPVKEDGDARKVLYH